MAISLSLAQKLDVKIVPYDLEVKNVNGGKCPIVGVVAPGELTVAFNTADRASTEFEIRPLVLKVMADDLNIGIAFMRKLKMQIQFGCPVEVWAPQLGRLIDPLAPPPPASQTNDESPVVEGVATLNQSQAKQYVYWENDPAEPPNGAAGHVPITPASDSPPPQAVQYIDRLAQQVRPGGNEQANLVWRDLWEGVDLLGEDGAPYFMKLDQFKKLPNAAAIRQVAQRIDFTP